MAILYKVSSSWSICWLHTKGERNHGRDPLWIKWRMSQKFILSHHRKMCWIIWSALGVPLLETKEHLCRWGNVWLGLLVELQTAMDLRVLTKHKWHHTLVSIVLRLRVQAGTYMMEKHLENNLLKESSDSIGYRGEKEWPVLLEPSTTQLCLSSWLWDQECPLHRFDKVWFWVEYLIRNKLLKPILLWTFVYSMYLYIA